MLKKDQGIGAHKNLWKAEGTGKVKTWNAKTLLFRGYFLTPHDLTIIKVKQVKLDKKNAFKLFFKCQVWFRFLGLASLEDIYTQKYSYTQSYAFFASVLSQIIQKGLQRKMFYSLFPHHNFTEPQ